MSDQQENKKQNTYLADPASHEHFCYYPFTQMLLQPSGVVSPCCWNQSIVLGKVPDKTLLEIWNDEPAQKLREEFLSGNPVSCATQIRHMNCHHWSRRSEDQSKWINKTHNIGPRRIDVRLNGKCNLQCVMCDVWQQPNGVYDQSDFWELGPTKFFPYLREIDVLGGEPFVQGDTYRLIDEISAVNKECQWAFVTNGNYKLNDTILSKLDKISMRWLQVSMDSINPETYAKVRLGGNLQKTIDTVEAYCKYRDKRAGENRAFAFTISMCVQKLNWREVGDFIAFAKNRNIEYILQFAYSPDHASLQSAPVTMQKEAFQYFADLRRTHGDAIIDHIYQPMKDQMRSLQCNELLEAHA